LLLLAACFLLFCPASGFEVVDGDEDEVKGLQVEERAQANNNTAPKLRHL